MRRVIFSSSCEAKKFESLGQVVHCKAIDLHNHIFVFQSQFFVDTSFTNKIKDKPVFAILLYWNQPSVIEQCIEIGQLLVDIGSLEAKDSLII